jgi:hypothetical protein
MTVNCTRDVDDDARRYDNSFMAIVRDMQIATSVVENVSDVHDFWNASEYRTALETNFGNLVGMYMLRTMVLCDRDQLLKADFKHTAATFSHNYRAVVFRMHMSPQFAGFCARFTNIDRYFKTCVYTLGNIEYRIRRISQANDVQLYRAKECVEQLMGSLWGSFAVVLHTKGGHVSIRKVKCLMSTCASLYGMILHRIPKYQGVFI